MCRRRRQGRGRDTAGRGASGQAGAIHAAVRLAVHAARLATALTVGPGRHARARHVIGFLDAHLDTSYLE